MAPVTPIMRGMAGFYLLCYPRAGRHNWATTRVAPTILSQPRARLARARSIELALIVIRRQADGFGAVLEVGHYLFAEYFKLLKHYALRGAYGQAHVDLI